MSNVVLAEVVSKEVSKEFPANSEKLYHYLEVKDNYRDWIKNRITQYGFKENEDYIIESIKTKGRPKKLYWITLDMAKELAMVENNEKGREARRYFIEIEKQYKDIFAGIQLDNVIPYEFKRELITTKRKLTLEKKKHRATAELYEQARKERDRLKLELVRVNDTLHAVMQRDLSKADIALVLYQLTNSFQTLPSIAKDGQNLNTDTKAGLEYWGKKYKPLIDEARDFENRIKNKMTQQLKLIVSTVERDIVNRFEESLEVSVRAVKLPYKG